MISLRSTSKKSWGVRVRKAFQLLGGMMGLLLFCLPLFSQGNSGRILGTVMDQSGGVVSGATVTVLDVSKGLKVVERQNVVLEVGKELRLDATLQPGDKSQTISITESVPLVET